MANARVLVDRVEALVETEVDNEYMITISAFLVPRRQDPSHITYEIPLGPLTGVKQKIFDAIVLQTTERYGDTVVAIILPDFSVTQF
jgi:hypothetical protein